MHEPHLMGWLEANSIKGKISFSFEYAESWLLTHEQFLLDPDISWFSGRQYPSYSGNFGIFLDSMPDTWGRTLMKRRVAFQAQKNSATPSVLNEVDFLLGVYDQSRMGALRFKLDPDGPFLDNSAAFPTPPWSSVRELQYSAKVLEMDEPDEDIQPYLQLIMAPGSSLGGARPKANILDKQGSLWIAKFPSKNDIIDFALWEMLVYKLAVKSKIWMAESKVERVLDAHHTFFTKRFDRHFQERIHFSSAMTMTGHNEKELRELTASYLELADFIQFSSASIEVDLAQLWRRIVFNIAVSNTDDHLRNHGFLLSSKGWRLSPAYDLNPSIDKSGLSLNIDLERNDLDFELAVSVGEYFLLNKSQMDSILKEVFSAVKEWKSVAKSLKIPRKEILLMEQAFRWK